MLCWYCIMYLLFGLVTRLLECVIWSACRHDTTLLYWWITPSPHWLQSCCFFLKNKGWISLISVETRTIVIVRLMFHHNQKCTEGLAKCWLKWFAGLIWNWIWGGLAYTNSACQHTWPWHPSAGCRFLSAGSSYFSPGCCNWISHCSLFLVSSGSFGQKPNDWEHCKLIGWREGNIWCRIKDTASI